VEVNEASHAAPIKTRRRNTREVCQRRPIRARTERACEFYSGLEPLSKRLAKLACLKAEEEAGIAEARAFAEGLEAFSFGAGPPCTPDDLVYCPEIAS